MGGVEVLGKVEMTYDRSRSGISGGDVLPTVRGRLFRKYIAMFVAVVCSALVVNGAFEIWFSYREQKSLLVRIQQEQADAAAASIGQFIKEIEGQLAWATLLSWDASSFDDWRFDVTRLLREVPAVTEVTQINGVGRELFRISRQAMDVVASQADRSHDPFFIRAMTNKIYYGPVYFVDGSEPYMTLAMAGSRPEYGVIEAQVNLKLIWNVVSQIKVDAAGYAYVVDSDGRLIAHPDISLVLRKTDFSRIPQVRAARSDEPGERRDLWSNSAGGGQGSVLSAHASIVPLDWLVFVELPTREAFAPIYNSIMRSAAILLAALALALLGGLILARRMVVPIRMLHDGATRVGSGDLTHRIAINTGDELEALGEQFNAMAARLEESYAGLEGKVEERTRQLEAANQAKSRFVAAASHDLRQPLHALGLFVAQLHGRMRATERRQIIQRIEAALAAMNELFSALLDISKLDAGATPVDVTAFPVAQLLAHAETTFAGAAREKALSFRTVPNDAWVRSDFILLEQIVFNLISNALRYTRRGGVLVGCRKRDGQLRIEVWDTGVGIAADQHDKIFGEFYRLSEPDWEHRGLGLGLAIVDRLCRMLGHPIELRSTPGKGSVFAVSVPIAPANKRAIEVLAVTRSQAALPNGKLVLVIDDDPLVLESMGGIFRRWGCQVVTADSDRKALRAITEHDRLPDVIISDYSLANGHTGIEAIEWLRQELAAPISAFLISGDTDPALLHEAKAKGFHLLHKPVDPMALRAMFNQAVKRSPAAAPVPTMQAAK
jgi:signal transduction histidine kinase/ActR/RegA family two-component response regulator